MTKSTPITDADLHGYADDRLDAGHRLAVEAWLAEHPADAERVHAWRAQRAGLHALFDTTLDEPVPDGLRFRTHRRRALPLQVAAVLAATVVGAVLGWSLRGERVVLETASLPQQAALAHAVYTPEVLHPVEVGAEQEAHLTAWLSKRLGAPLRAPHLAAAGFDLIGGRLLPGDGGPAAQFMYQDKSGRRLTLYVRSAAVDNTETAFRFAQEGRVGVFYWVDGPLGYALSGELDRPQLLHVAELVYRTLN